MSGNAELPEDQLISLVASVNKCGGRGGVNVTLIKWLLNFV